uniref:Uncharacterized protein n=1 Tax=Vespula pensylvanica TaxID=30213 RepID=A0A834JV31_VESPE|nr:hypothetical protein H0235_016762 [Vespula pensylvanica]
MKKTSRRLESAKRGTKRLRNVSSRRAYAADLEGRKKGSGHDYPKFIGSLHELAQIFERDLQEASEKQGPPGTLRTIANVFAANG